MYELATPLTIPESQFNAYGIEVDGLLRSNNDFTEYLVNDYDLFSPTTVEYSTNIADSVVGSTKAIVGVDERIDNLTASQVAVVDTGNYFPTHNLEAATQKLASDIINITTPKSVVYSGNVPAGATITAVTFNKFEYTGFYMDATASTYGIVGEINQAGNSIIASRGTGTVAEFNLTASDLFIAGFNSTSGARIDANISGENITLKVVNRDTSNPQPYRIVLYRTN
jgi:hypothetical protein